MKALLWLGNQKRIIIVFVCITCFGSNVFGEISPNEFLKDRLLSNVVENEIRIKHPILSRPPQSAALSPNPLGETTRISKILKKPKSYQPVPVPVRLTKADEIKSVSILLDFSFEKHFCRPIEELEIIRIVYENKLPDRNSEEGRATQGKILQLLERFKEQKIYLPADPIIEQNYSFVIESLEGLAFDPNDRNHVLQFLKSNQYLSGKLLQSIHNKYNLISDVELRKYERARRITVELMKMLPIVSGFENTWDFFDRKVVLDLLASELQHSFSERFLDDEFLKSTFKNAKSYSGLLFSMSKMHFLNFLSTITCINLKPGRLNYLIQSYILFDANSLKDKTIYNILREKLLIQAGSKKEEIHNRKRLVEDLLKIKILPNIRSTEDSNEGRRTYITLFYVLQYLIFKGKTEIKFERFEGKKLYKLLEIILFYINRNFKRSQFSRIMSRYRRESKPFTEGLNEVEKQSAIYKLSQDVQTLCYCFSGDTENFEVFMYYLSRDTSSRDHHYQSEAVSFKRPA